MTVAELIVALQKHDLTVSVEALVLKDDGEVLVAFVSGKTAKQMTQVLKFFK